MRTTKFIAGAALIAIAGMALPALADMVIVNSAHNSTVNAAATATGLNLDRDVVTTGDITVTGGDIVTAAGTASKIFDTNTTGNISIGTAITSGTISIGTGTGGSGSITIGSTSRAVVLPQTMQMLGRAELFTTTSTTIANGVDTALLFPSESFDGSNWHSTSTNTNRVTVDTAGVYRVTGLVRFLDNNSGNIRGINIRVDGVNVSSALVAKDGSGFGRATALAHWVGSLSANQYIDVTGGQDTGGNLGTASQYLGVERLQ